MNKETKVGSRKFYICKCYISSCLMNISGDDNIAVRQLLGVLREIWSAFNTVSVFCMYIVWVSLYINGTSSLGVIGISLVPWWRHQMETFFEWLALCAGNSLVTGEFPSQRPVTWIFDVFFDLRLNKRLCKPSGRRWFDTPSRSLWRHCNGENNHSPNSVRWCKVLWLVTSLCTD